MIVGGFATNSGSRDGVFRLPFFYNLRIGGLLFYKGVACEFQAVY